MQIISNSEALHSAFWSIYGLVVFYKIVVGYALFIDASAVKKGLQILDKLDKHFKKKTEWDFFEYKLYLQWNNSWGNNNQDKIN